MHQKLCNVPLPPPVSILSFAYTTGEEQLVCQNKHKHCLAVLGWMWLHHYILSGGKSAEFNYKVTLYWKGHAFVFTPRATTGIT